MGRRAGPRRRAGNTVSVTPLPHVDDAGQPVELAPGVLVMFTSRRGGVSAAPYDTLNMSSSAGDQASAVAANRRRVAQACGLQLEQLSWMRQVHGSAVSYARAAPRGEPPEGDAMFTDVPAPALAVLVPDCAPGLLAAPEGRIVGAAHSGVERDAARMVTGVIKGMT